MKNNWQIKKLGEICDFEGGSQPSKNNFIYTPQKGYVRFLQIRDFRTDSNITYIPESKKNRLCKEDDILIGRYGASVGKILINKKGAYNVAIIKTIPNFQAIEKKLFFYYLISEEFQSRLSKISARSAQAGFSKDDIYDFPVSIPPLSEQQGIITILDKAFAAIDKAVSNAEQNLKNAKVLFESYLNGSLADKKWERKTIGDVCERVEYGSSTKSKEVGKVAVLRMGNIQNGRFIWDKLVYSDDADDNRQYLLNYNDVLFNRTNSPELVGKTAIYKGEMPAIFAGYLIRLHRKEKLLDADYLNYYLNSEMAIEYGKTVVISSVNQANINGTKLKGYPIPCPPLRTQQAIVQNLDFLSTEIKKLEAIYQAKINELEVLKKSFLQKAFSGEFSKNTDINTKVHV